MNQIEEMHQQFMKDLEVNIVEQSINALIYKRKYAEGEAHLKLIDEQSQFFHNRYKELTGVDYASGH